MSLLGNIVDSVIEGAVKKALAGFVAKKELTPAQAAVIAQATVDELQLALEIYQAGQTKS